jgi:hypothetical protein
MKVTKDMLEDWIGSDNMDSNSFLDLLLELINGKYAIEVFKQDVLEYAKESLIRKGVGK